MRGRSSRRHRRFWRLGRVDAEPAGGTPTLPGLWFAGDVNGAGGVAREERIVEADDVGLGGGKDDVEGGDEIGVGRVVGPEGEDAARVKAGSKGAETVDGVEGGVARVEEVAWGVVDVEQNGVEEPARLQRIEASRG